MMPHEDDSRLFYHRVHNERQGKEISKSIPRVNKSILLPFHHFMGFAKWLCVLLLCAVSSTKLASAQLGFKCSTPGSTATCRSLVGYPSPNKTTISAIRKFLGVKNLRNLLGANSLPPSTPPDYPVEANQVIRVPVPCMCYNGSGVSNRVPMYTVQKDDGLYYIASSVFMGLVTSQQIQQANEIPNADIIDVGQRLWIPLPCSCDAVEEQPVVHYGHVVVGGSTVEQIAQQFGTTAEVVYGLNGIANNSQLIEGNVIDVPLPGNQLVL